MQNKTVLRSGAVVVLTALLVMLGALVAACGGESTTSTTTASTESTAVASDVTASPENGEPQPLLVAAASSLKEAFTEIGEVFDAANNAETTFTFDASGSLQKQIEAGAPVDVFASAAAKQVDALLEQDLVDEESRTTFASNEIVLAVPAGSTLGIAGFDDLTKDEVQKVTTGDPETAPQGKTAVEILTKLGLLDAVQPKLIYAKNASQTLTYVVEGEVDAGLMFATDAIAGGDKVEVVATSDPTQHGALAYVTVVVGASEAKLLAQAFIDFVAGPEGQAILQKYGFLPPSSS